MPLSTELAEPARAESAAEQSRLADLARGGPLGRAVVRAVESGSLQGAVSFGAPEAAGAGHGGKVSYGRPGGPRPAPKVGD